jgi:predicted membrane protein
MMPHAAAERAMMRAIRIASFMIALAASLALMLFPFLLRHVQEARLHWALPILLLGIAGAFVFGIGYRPDNRPLRILFGPIFPWALMFGGASMLFAK